jgi:hypothetical protein
MAYSSRNLSVLAYANGFTFWHYRTADAAATVDNSGYFNATADAMRVGDMILLNAGVGGTPANGILVVAAKAGGVIDTSNMTALGDSNSD